MYIGGYKMDFILNNIASIMVVLIVALLVVLVVRSMIKDKKNGKSCCGGCSGCPSSGMCHAAKTIKIDIKKNNDN